MHTWWLFNLRSIKKYFLNPVALETCFERTIYEFFTRISSLLLPLLRKGFKLFYSGILLIYHVFPSLLFDWLAVCWFIASRGSLDRWFHVSARSYTDRQRSRHGRSLSQNHLTYGGLFGHNACKSPTLSHSAIQFNTMAIYLLILIFCYRHLLCTMKACLFFFPAIALETFRCQNSAHLHSGYSLSSSNQKTLIKLPWRYNVCC